jgi:hypothetical protein
MHLLQDKAPRIEFPSLFLLWPGAQPCSLRLLPFFARPAEPQGRANPPRRALDLASSLPSADLFGILLMCCCRMSVVSFEVLQRQVYRGLCYGASSKSICGQSTPQRMFGA